MQSVDANVQYRNSVFCSYFQEPSRLLSLCNAILDTNHTDTSKLELTTLEGTFFSNIKNDISCKIGDNFLVLVEHQSSINENMPFRCLSYVTEVMNNLIEDKDRLYKKSLIHFPTPRFVVLYDGDDNEPLKREMRLSDAFAGDSSAIELIVTSYNINYSKEQEILEKCPELKEYSIFVNQVKEALSVGYSLDNAIAYAVDYCLKNNIMYDYLKLHGKEVYSMTRLEWNEDTARRVWKEEAREEGMAQGMEQGMEQGIKKGKKETTIKMIRDFLDVGTPINFIVKATGWSEQQILALKTQ